MIYKTAARAAEAEVVEKKSRFIALCAPAKDEAEARALLAEAGRRHFDARHHCFAYRGRTAERSGDGGEPSGTAGAPILAALRGAGLTDACCIVTRYFGGTLLGTGGLARAYGAAAKAAVEAAGVITRQSATRFAVTLDYPLEARARAALTGYAVTGAEYGERVMFTALAAEGEEAAFSAALTEACYGGCGIVILGSDYITLSEV